MNAQTSESTPVFLLAAKAAPKDTRKWPKVAEGQTVCFMPYGPKGRGFYTQQTQQDTRGGARA